MSNSMLDIYKKIAEASAAGIKAASESTRASNEGVSVPLAAPSVKPANPVGTALDKNYAAQSKNALDKYNTAHKELEESRARAKKEAGFNNTKLMKYMPSILKRQGLSGLGVSQSAVIAANNNYGRQLTDIESDFQKNSADLLQNYNDAKLAYDTQYNTQKAQLEQAELDKQEVAKEKAEAKAEADQTSNFENAWEIISADTTSTDFSELLASYQGKVSEADYNTLVYLAAAQVAKNQAAKEEKSEADLKEEKSEAKAEALALMDLYLASEEYEKGLEYLESQKEILSESVYNAWKGYFEAEMGKKDEGEVVDAYENMSDEEMKQKVLEGKEFVSFNGQDYRLTYQPLDTVTTSSNNPLALTSFFDELAKNNIHNANDANIPNGTTIEVTGPIARILETDKDFFGAIGAGVTNMTAKDVSFTVTYYEGNWYISEHKGTTAPNTQTTPSNGNPFGAYVDAARERFRNTNRFPEQPKANNLLNYLFDH